MTLREVTRRYTTCHRDVTKLIVDPKKTTYIHTVPYVSIQDHAGASVARKWLVAPESKLVRDPVGHGVTHKSHQQKIVSFLVTPQNIRIIKNRRRTGCQLHQENESTHRTPIPPQSVILLPLPQPKHGKSRRGRIVLPVGRALTSRHSRVNASPIRGPCQTTRLADRQLHSNPLSFLHRTQ